MLSCQDIQEKTYPFLDGGLSDSEQDAVRRHLEGCTACATEIATTRLLEQELRAAIRNEPLPERLWPRIQTSIRSEARAGTASRRPAAQRRPLRRWAALATAAVTMVVLVLAWGLAGRSLRTGEIPTAQFSEETVNELRTFVVSRRQLDVTTTDPLALRGWFVGKVDFTPPSPPTATAGLRLAGGRLCYLFERRVASYMYRTHGRFVSLYVMKRTGLEVPRDRTVQLVDRQVAIYESEGYTHVLWESGPLRFSLIGELPRARLLDLARDLIAGVAADTPFGTVLDITPSIAGRENFHAKSMSVAESVA